jgi:hypothetical protein
LVFTSIPIVLRKGAFKMPSSARWGYFRFAVAARVPTLLAAIAVLLLIVACPLSAQVTSSPKGEIFKAPGTQTFTFTIPAGTNVGSVSVLTLGAPNLDFTEVAGGTTCPNVTAGTCAVEVQFQPTQAGRRLGEVVLSDPSGKLLIAVSLDGAGSAAMAGFSPSIISTFAGGGTGGVGGPATSAKLAGPTGIAIDGFGNYYIVDQKGNKVLKVTPAGTISTFAGTGTAGYSGDGGPATSAQLDGPSDVIVDGAGYVYISDTNNNVVRLVNTAGIISTYAGQYWKTGTTPPPVCAAATNSVGDGCPGNQIVLNTPVGLVFCHAQNLHIADKLNNRVRTVNHVGYNTITQVGDGTQGYNGDGENNTAAELNGPMGLDMDAANYIYVADSGNHIIRKTLLTGTTPNPIATVAGTPGSAGNSGDGGAATSAQLNNPWGVRVDPAGDIFITDSSSQVVREVNVANGQISTIAGTGTAGYTGDGGAATAAQMNAPMNLAIDNTGNLYVADSQNGVIRKIDLFDAPSLSFSATPVGTSTTAQDVSVMNIGSAPLTISSITTPAGFSLGGADTTCSSSGSDTLNPGADCVLGIEFAPQSSGTITGNMVVTDNSTPTTQTIALTGAGNSTSGAYTLSVKMPSVSITPGGSGSDTLNLSSTTFAGTVSFTTSVASTDGTAANVTATASPVTLAPGGSGTSTVTISANSQAMNRAPSSPWATGSAAGFCAFLIGLPLISRRRRTLNLLLLVLVASLAGSLMVACGGTSNTKRPGQSGRTYTVTITPTATSAGSGTVTNPAPVSITVTVQ